MNGRNGTNSDPLPSKLESGAGVRNGAGVHLGVTGAAMSGGGAPGADSSGFRNTFTVRVISVASFHVGKLCTVDNVQQLCGRVIRWPSVHISLLA